MSERERNGDQISAHISGPVSGQAAVGKDISQTQRGTADKPLSAAERAELWQAIAELQARVTSEAPAEKRDDALSQVSELERAAVGEKPNVSAISNIKNWFADNVPTLAGVVTEILVKLAARPC